MELNREFSIVESDLSDYAGLSAAFFIANTADQGRSLTDQHIVALEGITKFALGAWRQTS
jgi:hypothetical protein